MNIDGIEYVTLTEAAQATGYSAEYLGQLAVQGKIESRLVGSARVVTLASIQAYKAGDPHRKTHKEPSRRRPS